MKGRYCDYSSFCLLFLDENQGSHLKIIAALLRHANIFLFNCQKRMTEKNDRDQSYQFRGRLKTCVLSPGK